MEISLSIYSCHASACMCLVGVENLPFLPPSLHALVTCSLSQMNPVKGLEVREDTAPDNDLLPSVQHP